MMCCVSGQTSRGPDRPSPPCGPAVNTHPGLRLRALVGAGGVPFYTRLRRQPERGQQHPRNLLPQASPTPRPCGAQLGKDTGPGGADGQASCFVSCPVWPATSSPAKPTNKGPEAGGPSPLATPLTATNRLQITRGRGGGRAKRPRRVVGREGPSRCGWTRPPLYSASRAVAIHVCILILGRWNVPAPQAVTQPSPWPRFSLSQSLPHMHSSSH